MSHFRAQSRHRPDVCKPAVGTNRRPGHNSNAAVVQLEQNLTPIL